MSNKNFNKGFERTLTDAFKKIDEFRIDFQEHFSAEICKLTQKQCANISMSELREPLLAYSHEIFSCTEAILDKDEHYSNFRLEEELEAITLALKRFEDEAPMNKFAQQTHRKAKEITVSFFPELVDLSGNGFRLLEKYCLMYNREFVRAIENRKRN